jgi:hypothetical protein
MIHILYRHTSNISGVGKNRPNWFSYDKCLNNILDTIEENELVQFHLLYDGKCNITDKRIHNTVEFLGGSDLNSFHYAWNYAKQLNLNEKDLIYFLENDYMHVPGWIDKVIDLYKEFNISGYVSLYDHLDKYTLSIYNDLQSQIYITNTSHWRTTPSTCGSFIVNVQTLNEDFDIHTSFPGDHNKFLYLGQNRDRIIISPIPSLSTHCEIEYLAPLINWGIL